ncbi:hypothetical protein FACS1894182_13470 [Bacteroidia bacterium]|nr:hypothetical protein FACS1894182_13470 [Bacteroidia bacterium]
MITKATIKINGRNSDSAFMIYIYFYNSFKNIRDDFAATPNPFNQNLNYEKILHFSNTKVRTFFILPNFSQKKCVSL